MNEYVRLTIKISTRDKYDCTSDVEESIMQAPFESIDAFLARARAMYEKLRGG